MTKRSIRTLVERTRERWQRAKEHELYQRAAPAVRKTGQLAIPVLALFLLFLCMGGTWHLASASPSAPIVAAAPSADGDTAHAVKKSGKDLAGKLNLNTATEEQLMLLPTVGPAKAERIVAWRKKNGGFKRTADLRRVKGFGYKTFKRLEPFLDIKGDTTLK
jgi:competence ComEA-like helix-hairpin-helix protein